MTWSEYQYAPTGWDAPLVDFKNFEATFTRPYLSAPHRVPRGSVVNKASDGSEVTDGWREISLEQLGEPYGTTLKEDLDDYVEDVFGSWDGEDTAEIAVSVRDIDGTFKYYNVLAFLPQVGTSFEFVTSTELRDLKLRFLVVAEYTPA